MRKILCSTVVLFIIVFSSCNAQDPQKRQMQIEYEEAKIGFDSVLTSHFPINLLPLDSTELIRRERVEFNDISIFLYQYYLSDSQVDFISTSISNYNPIAEYKSFDTCLLIVNRFETKEMYEHDVAPEITDSSLINRECYSGFLPVPNFIDGGGKNETNCGLDKSFTIYVLDAKPEKPFPQYDLKPFTQMPPNWTNGYSRGIAISKENKIVIYWSIVW